MVHTHPWECFGYAGQLPVVIMILIPALWHSLSASGTVHRLKGTYFLLTKVYKAEVGGGKDHGICQLSRFLRTCLLEGRGGRR